MRTPSTSLGLVLFSILSLFTVVLAHGGHSHGHRPAQHLDALYGFVDPACDCPKPTPPTHLKSCDFIVKLSQEKLESRSGGLSPDASGQGIKQRRLFAILFPFDNPGWNALASTFYISSVPNALLWFIPAEINPDALNTMVAFATGGLLGDVFLHLLPATFISSTEDINSAQFVMVEEKRNILLGLAIFLGFATFFCLEKGMRVLNGGQGGHDHSHGHSHETIMEEIIAPSAIVEEKPALRKRTVKKVSDDLIVLDGNGNEVDLTTPPPSPIASLKVLGENVKEKSRSIPEKEVNLSAYLNLFADAAHNMTDGLAISASFYASTSIGATTSVAVFFHEIPHEMADFSILLKSGFSKKKAMMSQCFTALGAFVGTYLGIILHSAPATSTSSSTTSSSLHSLTQAIHSTSTGLFGTTVTLSECVIPFTAGTFIYIATVGVVPGLLKDTKSAGGGLQAVREILAMTIGVGVMFAIAWNE